MPEELCETGISSGQDGEMDTGVAVVVDNVDAQAEGEESLHGTVRVDFEVEERLALRILEVGVAAMFNQFRDLVCFILADGQNRDTVL